MEAIILYLLFLANYSIPHNTIVSRFHDAKFFDFFLRPVIIKVSEGLSMIFFIISILLYLLQNVSNKKFCTCVGSSSTGTALIQNGICCLCASVVLVIYGGFHILSPGALCLAILFGISYLGTVFLLLLAFSTGTVGLSTLLCNIGMFIAAFYGMIRFGDAFTVFIAAGYACMLAAVILTTPRKKEDERGGVRWFLFALGSGLCNGFVASVKREAVGILPEGIPSFLAIGFLFASLFALTFAFAVPKHRERASHVIKRPRILLFGALAGVGTAGANLFQMQALTTLPSTVVYPLTSGILVVSLWLASLWIYRETTAKPRNIISVILCVLAIILANIKL